jgi:hypothetical protein
MTTTDARDPMSVAADIERAIEKLDALADPHGRAQAQELVRLLMMFYGAGLARVVDIVRSEKGGPRAIVDRLAADELVASLLALHDLHPQPAPQPALIQIVRRPPDDRQAPLPDLHTSADRCGLCGAETSSDHPHLVDRQMRRLVCACAICAAAGNGSAGHASRYQKIPDRYVQLLSMPVSDSRWDALAIPVGLAFFFLNSELGRIVALYPGPAGATESTLPLDAWPKLAEADPLISTMEPDVEALLVRRTGESFTCFLVPVDACYELAGRIRGTWTGLTGGDGAQAEIDAFFERVRERSRS